MPDTTHHIDAPSHYIAETPQGRRIEVIEVIHAYGLGYDLGNIVKYVTRAGRKTLDPRADLRKAIKYTEFAAAAMQPLGVFLEAAREAAPTPAEIAAAFGLSARLSMALGLALRPFPHRLDMADLAAHLRAALDEVEEAMMGAYVLVVPPLTERQLSGKAFGPQRVNAVSRDVFEIVPMCEEPRYGEVALDEARESGEISEIEHARRVRSLRAARVTDAADTVGGDVVPA